MVSPCPNQHNASYVALLVYTVLYFHSKQQIGQLMAWHATVHSTVLVLLTFDLI